MDLWPPNVYRRQARAEGTPPAAVDAALDQAHLLQQGNLPPVLTLGHLAWHVDVPVRYLRWIVMRLIEPYRTFRIRKRRGGYRQIFVPDVKLLLVQKWINKYILAEKQPHHASFAYTPGSTIVRCAKMHIGCRWLVKVDVRQFF